MSTHNMLEGGTASLKLHNAVRGGCSVCEEKKGKGVCFLLWCLLCCALLQNRQYIYEGEDNTNAKLWHVFNRKEMWGEEGGWTTQVRKRSKE
eukprot:NODE_2241_length_378_cov_109.737052_g2231_i0.p1 GENE.NODE_2241_length_378_cov_109.737052_g2231_i0~~NODE_2241_length_378_cov_109.737052_g2231_i0.p1  ORF type:complete len:92 (-),score=13.35 NODE_2241_length_378_cov_109.737052_g2231_i0:67-342(-)